MVYYLDVADRWDPPLRVSRPCLGDLDRERDGRSVCRR